VSGVNLRCTRAVATACRPTLKLRCCSDDETVLSEDRREQVEDRAQSLGSRARSCTIRCAGTVSETGPGCSPPPPTTPPHPPQHPPPLSVPARHLLSELRLGFPF